MVTTPHSDLILALDQGGHASRALVFDGQGRQCLEAFAAIGTQRSGTDRVEHDATELLHSLRTVIADVAYNLGADVRRVRAAGLATQRSSIVCWDAHNGAALSPVLSWQDRRNAALVKQLDARRADIQRITGLMLSPHYGASKIRWCLDHLPAVQQAWRDSRLQCGPLATYLLQGLLRNPQAQTVPMVDPANASRTQLWSPATRDWSPDLLQAFGVPRELLPHCVPTAFDYGLLDLDEQQVPLTLCTGDQAAVPFAQGALDSHAIYLNLGTGAFALLPLDHDLDDAAPLLRSVLWSDAQQVRYALEGTVNGAASALQWLGERNGLEVTRAAQALTRAQRDAIHVPIFINAVGGIGSPYWLSHLEPQFIDEHSAQTDNALAQVAAVLDSIAFLIADNVTLMRERVTNPPQHIIAGGGLAACNYLCAAIATLTGLPLERLSATELTGTGLAFLTAGQPAAWWRDRHATEFQPENDAPLQSRHAQWRQYIAQSTHI